MLSALSFSGRHFVPLSTLLLQLIVLLSPPPTNTATATATATESDTAGSCSGPLQSALQFGVQPYAEDDSYFDGMSLPAYICCHNQKWAEHWGFLADSGVDLFTRLAKEMEGAAQDAPAPTFTFYDSTECAVPLFHAPVGRTFDEWKSESLAHGWPSFRDEEVVWENVVVKQGGETASVCGTHLGHNLPDSQGNRYCIDLVCIAGAQAPGSGNNNTDSSNNNSDGKIYTGSDASKDSRSNDISAQNAVGTVPSLAMWALSVGALVKLLQ